MVSKYYEIYERKYGPDVANLIEAVREVLRWTEQDEQRALFNINYFETPAVIKNLDVALARLQRQAGIRSRYSE